MRQIFAIATAHIPSAGKDIPLDPDRILTACASVVYEWDLTTDRLQWGPNLRQVFGLDRRHRLASGRAYNALIVPGSGDSRDEAVLASGQVDRGRGAPYRCRYVIGFGQRKFVIDDCGFWFAGAEGRPAWARGTVRGFPLGRKPADPDRGSAQSEPARERMLRLLTSRLHDPAGVRRQTTVMVATVEGAEIAETGTPARAATEADMARLETRLRRHLRRRDVLELLSPTRFAIVLNSCELAQALPAARALLSSTAEQAKAVGLVMRLGVVTAGDRTGDASALLERAEEAADHARLQGQPTWQMPPRLRRRAVARTRSPSPVDLIAALNDRRVGLDRCALVELGARRQLSEHVWQTGERPLAAHAHPALISVQAGVHDADAGFSGSAALSPIAERLGLSALLDHRVLELTLRALRDEPQAHMMMTVSAATLEGPGWLATLAAYLGAHRDIVDRLVIGIDERAFGRDPATGCRPVPATTVAANLSAMKALGTGTAITSYGGGRLRLADLSDLSVDLVAIDRSLVSGAVSASQSRFLLRSLLAGTRHLGLPAFGQTGEASASAGGQFAGAAPALRAVADAG